MNTVVATSVKNGPMGHGILVLSRVRMSKCIRQSEHLSACSVEMTGWHGILVSDRSTVSNIHGYSYSLHPYNCACHTQRCPDDVIHSKTERLKISIRGVVRWSFSFLRQQIRPMWF